MRRFAPLSRKPGGLAPLPLSGSPSLIAFSERCSRPPRAGRNRATATPPVRSDGKASDEMQMRFVEGAKRPGFARIRVSLSHPARLLIHPPTIFRKKTFRRNQLNPFAAEEMKKKEGCRYRRASCKGVCVVLNEPVRVMWRQENSHSPMEFLQCHVPQEVFHAITILVPVFIY